MATLNKVSQEACWCCGSKSGTRFKPSLWPELGAEWELSSEEYEYIDRQQGEVCTACNSNLRSQALAKAILLATGARGPLKRFTVSVRGRLLRLLEINRAGHLTEFLTGFNRHRLMEYPQLDMMNMPSDYEGHYDLVVHSDTLEHLPDPVRGLRECYRVLKPGGAICFTVPIVVGRLTRSRSGLPPSYHGSRDHSDYLVHTEYGADAWRHVLQAGFTECRITAVRPPIAHALVGMKTM